MHNGVPTVLMSISCAKRVFSWITRPCIPKIKEEVLRVKHLTQKYRLMDSGLGRNMMEIQCRMIPVPASLQARNALCAWTMVSVGSLIACQQKPNGNMPHSVLLATPSMEISKPHAPILGMASVYVTVVAATKGA